MKPIPNPDDMNGDVPVADLPFHKWMAAQEEPPARLVDALYAYFETDDLKGKFTENEATTYRHVHQHFWWLQHHNIKQ